MKARVQFLCPVTGLADYYPVLLFIALHRVLN